LYVVLPIEIPAAPENPQRGTENLDPLPNPWGGSSTSARSSTSSTLTNSTPAANPFRYVPRRDNIININISLPTDNPLPNQRIFHIPFHIPLQIYIYRIQNLETLQAERPDLFHNLHQSLSNTAFLFNLEVSVLSREGRHSFSFAIDKRVNTVIQYW